MIDALSLRIVLKGIAEDFRGCPVLLQHQLIKKIFLFRVQPDVGAMITSALHNVDNCPTMADTVSRIN